MVSEPLSGKRGVKRMKEEVVTLIRRFTPAAPQRGDWEFLSPDAGGAPVRWPAIDALYRTLILADPGAGKTFEALDRARKLTSKGQRAFFIRIEKLTESFENAVEVGSAEAFDGWLTSTDEAWFFLDSVDEAQLDTPRAFEDAIRVFSTRIHAARARAHIVITSREDAWQALSDRMLIDDALPFEANDCADEDPPEVQGAPEKKNAWRIFRLAPLDRDQIKIFTSYHGVGDVDAFLTAVERARLMPLAERPFDLRALLRKWQADRALGSRLEILQRLTDLQIAPLSMAGQAVRLDRNRAQQGVRALAATATLTAKNVIKLANGPSSPDRVDPKLVLPDWSDDEIDALLKTGVFDDIVYGSVRFRHREIRELLTADWAAANIERPGGRQKIEPLFFRISYDQEIIVPRLRPTLAWLILFDEQIRDHALAIAPEVATEGGDPSRLPTSIRRTMLGDIVRRIAAEDEIAPWMDNAAITRIAAADLADETQALLQRYAGNDDAVFFLGRFVWQGEIGECVPLLAPIATDMSRGLSARIAAVRAVMTAGEEDGRQALKAAILGSGAPLDRRWLAEIIINVPATLENVDFLLTTIARVDPSARAGSGLRGSLTNFIECLPLMIDTAPEQPLLNLIEGLDVLLSVEPYIERHECCVSEQNAWLISAALHAVGRLVSARARGALEPSAISILIKAQSVNFWGHNVDIEDKDRLTDLVPRWLELNDALYWRMVEERRARKGGNGERLTDDWQLTAYERFWKFTGSDFGRVISWITTRELLDDRLVALSRSFSLYLNRGKPDDWVSELRLAVKDQPELEASLQSKLNPPQQEEAGWQVEHRNWERKRARQQRKANRDRAAWVSELQTDPDRVRNPNSVTPGQMTNDHLHLLLSVNGEGWTRYDARSNWRSLEAEFGTDVAEAFREAAAGHWRHYQVPLPSEGADRSSIPYALVFALVGLAIEAEETPDFNDKLTSQEAEQAFRYLTRELNGFPRWFERLYRKHRDIGLRAVIRELTWELETTSTGPAINYILSDIVHHAPWLYADIAPTLLAWLEDGKVVCDENLNYILTIMQGADDYRLKALARTRITVEPNGAQRPRWFAVWVGQDPEQAIPALQAELDGMAFDNATLFAQHFVVSLVGSRHLGEGTTEEFRTTAVHLKSLYVLMHRFIRAEDDIERANTGVYSPELRDHAQDARNMLFKMLAESPGEGTFWALKELANDHPDEKYRLWMAERARQRAVADGDEPVWSDADIHAFSTAAD
ncbi:NACHT domain-containing protein [Agrobacterium vitis]|uniref:NACHT domain-containing protein n=1 Tax=Agrobacterium vitis TaxID=373 RepID=UPI002034AB4C|nr:hypothetical protein [Agrobacterium vitis]MCM2453438.1 hypothetical protein [Agrobacterium vitis]